MKKRIAHITDTHLDESTPRKNGIDTRKNWKQILNDVASRNIEEIVFAGDIGETETYPWFFDSIKDYNFDLKITLGNHDSFPDAMKYYKNGIAGGKSLYYSYEDEHIKYLYLDSSSEEIDTVQFKWMLSELETRKKVLLFIHHPVLKVEAEIDRQYPLRGRERIKEVLHQFENKVFIFCGHYHMTDERTEENVRQFITPAGSFQILKQEGTIELDSSTFGYRIININDGEITTEVLMNREDDFFNFLG